MCDVAVSTCQLLQRDEGRSASAFVLLNACPSSPAKSFWSVLVAVLSRCRFKRRVVYCRRECQASKTALRTSITYNGESSSAQCQYFNAVVVESQSCKGCSTVAVRFCPRNETSSWEIQVRNACTPTTIPDPASHFHALEPWMKSVGFAPHGDGFNILWDDM